MLKERILVLLSFCVIALIAYRSAFGIFIPSDNFSELFFYAKHGAEGINLHFNNGVIYLFSFPVIYFLYNLFGTDPYCWMALSVLLHAVISYLVFIIAKELTNPLFEKQSNYLGIVSGLLFLLSPYQTEAVIWSPTCLSMLFASFWTLFSLYFSIKYFSTQKTSYLCFLHLGFLLAVFSYESSFFLPFACAALFAYMRFTKITKVEIRTAVIKVLLPLLGLVFGYFLICKVFFGEWLIHGGTSFDFQTNIGHLTENLLKYFAKFFMMYRYWNFYTLESWIEKIYPGSLVAGALLILTFTLLFFAFLSSFKKQKEAACLVLVLFICFLFALLPVLPLDTSFLKIIYSDRYGYLPSVFFYMSIVIAIYALFKRIAFPLLTGIAVLFCILLDNTITAWKDTNQYCYALLKNFEPYMDRDKIYILNLPSYYNGIAAFRTGFLESIYFKYHKDVPKKSVAVISHSYMSSVVDSISVVKKNSKDLEVSASKRKTPYFGSGGGWAQSYSNADYTVTFDISKCAYLLSFQDSIPRNAVILQVSGTEWEKIEF